MEQGKLTGHNRKGKHLTKEERVVMERMSRAGRPARDIAEVLGRHRRTVERELLRGSVQHKDSLLRAVTVYSSDRGQDVHDLNATAKGPDLKLGKNHELVEFTRNRIVNHKESPDVVAFRMKAVSLSGAVCTKTLYNYIDNGSEFLDVDRLQASVFSKQKRTSFFYAHPYSSWERGSNENINRIIRRFIAKGRKIEDFSRDTISTIEDWINNYPRKRIHFKTAQQLFNAELQGIVA